MEAEDLRRWMRDAGVDLWALIDTAISVAAAEHRQELRARRDGIVQRLYAAGDAGRCRNCGSSGGGSVVPRREEAKGSSSSAEKRAAVGAASPPSPESMNRTAAAAEEEEQDDQRTYGRSIDEEQSKILDIKRFLDDPDQSEDSLVRLLQNLADMDITFRALKETDIGRHVNGLRKHPSSEVRRLVKQLVRKWKDLVDEWVTSNSACDTASPAIITDGDSPQQISGKNNQNGHHVPEFGYSPNPHAGYLSSERNSSESVEPKAKSAINSTKTNNTSTHAPSSASPAHKVKEHKDSLLDPERLASARKRLHENYQEAQNAKKQRTIQVMDIHQIPKPKIPRKGGSMWKH
ncbi:probable mediator of RNA polymerase II transcription subunit 26c isoform X2 [Musa acuminata AAA Group]|uniref:probable mediator of RNA polymerase II transcription subunit 26c isoform X2 n=1 Tax=Musa acuminata AAA Group TaxID=214697 RepID=UPI0031E17104